MCKDLIILCCLQLDAENTQKEVTFSIRLDNYGYAFYMFDFNYNLPVIHHISLYLGRIILFDNLCCMTSNYISRFVEMRKI